MRTYRKVYMNEDFTVASANQAGSGASTATALVVPHTKAQIIAAYNRLASINLVGFGGPVWGIIDFNPPFNARTIATFNGPDLASNIFTTFPYQDRPRN